MAQDKAYTAFERFLSARGREQRPAAREFVRALKAALDDGQAGGAARLLRMAALPIIDYTTAQAFCRVLAQLKPHLRAPSASIAILSSFTADQLSDFIELFLFAEGGDAALYRSEYGVFRQEVLDPESGLYASDRAFVFLAVNHRDLLHVPALGESRDQVEERAQREFAGWHGLWDTLHQRLGCQVIQNSFDVPPWRVLGNRALAEPSSLPAYAARVNRLLFEQAPPYVTVHDVDHLAAQAGRRAWAEPRFHYQAKLPCAPEFLAGYAHSVAAVIAAHMGKVRKCLVLDLDNTLWGGVIGDDGLSGIRIGHGDPEAEAYLAFQEYAKALRQRGIVLAVCSKNGDANAREPFEKHPEMALRLDDIAAFVANWDDKPANLRRIAAQLDLGLDSFVFVDDHPAERALVRCILPEVAVPELPEDPAGYIDAIDRYRYFETASLSADDLRRADFYRGNAERRTAEASATDLDAFLDSLDMSARVAPISEQTLPRCVQLISRSNQFNLTTRRHTAARVAGMMASPEWLTFAVSLRDRFGDNGLISVVLARQDGGMFEIDTWLMSCRVLKRGVERFVLNKLCEAARERGARYLLGDYVPTKKNGLVREHYAQLGFELLEQAGHGSSRWQLEVGEDWRPLDTHIKEDGDGTA